MDPDACYEELHDAINAHELDVAYERASALHRWLSVTGFMPNSANVKELVGMLVVCLSVINSDGN